MEVAARADIVRQGVAPPSGDRCQVGDVQEFALRTPPDRKAASKTDTGTSIVQLFHRAHLLGRVGLVRAGRLYRGAVNWQSKRDTSPAVSLSEPVFAEESLMMLHPRFIQQPTGAVAYCPGFGV